MPEDLAAHERYWRELAQLTGLTYYPDYSEQGLWIHRMIGRIGPYLTLVKFHLVSEPLRPVVGVLIRYLPGLDAAASPQAIRTESDLADYSDKAKQRKGFGLVIGDNYAWFTFPYDPKKEAVESVSEKVKALVHVISRHGRPTNQCEGAACPTRGSEEPQLVLVDNLPTQLCQVCLEQLPAQQKKEQAAYYAAPTRLLNGILPGIGVAVLGAIAWAVIVVAFQIAAASVSLLTFGGIVVAMDRSKTKRTPISLLVAGGLAIVSSVLGAYLAAFGALLRESPTILSAATLPHLLEQLQQVVAMNRLLGLSIGFCLLGVVPVAGLIWRQQKHQLEATFQHRIEIVDLTRVFRSLY